MGEGATSGARQLVELPAFSLQWSNSFCVSALLTEECWTRLLPWGPVDLVVSNPPYIFHKDMEELAPEICRYRVGGAAGEL